MIIVVLWGIIIGAMIGLTICVFVVAIGGLRRRRARAREFETISDGFGSEWSRICPECGRSSMVVVRPGKCQCNNCG